MFTPLKKVNLVKIIQPRKGAGYAPSSSSDRLCAGHGTRLKGEPTFSNYGSQGKSQAQPDGGEGYSVITTGYSVTVPLKAVALLRQGSKNGVKSAAKSIKSALESAD